MNLILAHPWALALLPLPALVWFLVPPHRQPRQGLVVPFLDQLARLTGISPAEGAVVSRGGWLRRTVLRRRRARSRHLVAATPRPGSFRCASWQRVEECCRKRDIANHPTSGRAAVDRRAARAVMYEPSISSDVCIKVRARRREPWRATGGH